MRCLITGITGTLGQAVARILLEDPNNEVLGVSRDEQKQRLLSPHPRLSLHLGDVRDADRIVELSRSVNVIFHFAALKCVDTLEDNVDECIKTNVLGTRNVIAAQFRNHIDRVVLSSTDKAAYPINTYGASKALAEKIVLQNKNNIVCRYGNVIASRGSVIPMFVKSLKSEKKVFITHPQMTRFFIRIEDAAKFVVDQSTEANGGLKIPEMSSARIMDLAESVASLIGVSGYEMKITGMRPGEKIDECLRTRFEGTEVFSNTANRFTETELKNLIAPAVGAL